MSVRTRQIYVSGETLKLLRGIAKNLGGGCDMTPDQVADELLQEIIAEKYPESKAILEKIEELETQLVESLK